MRHMHDSMECNFRFVRQPMRNRIFVRLSLTCLLVLILAPLMRAQAIDQAGNLTDSERAHLRQVLDPTSNPEEFRREYADYLAEMETAMAPLLNSRFSRELLVQNGLNPMEDLFWARQRLQSLTEQELFGLRAALSKNLEWRSAPRRIQMLMRPEIRDLLDKLDNRQNARRETLPGGTTEDVCDNAFRSGNIPRASNSDISIAAGFVLAASAVVDSLPDDFLSVAGKAIAVVARTIVEAVLLTFESLKSISDDCGGSRFETSVDTTLATIKSTTQSTQSTVSTNLNATVASRATQSSLDIVGNNVITANEALVRIESKSGAIQDGVTLINGKLDDRLDVKVSTRATQASVNTVQATSNIIIAKLDALADELARFRAENLRLQIELNLLLGPRYNHVLFQQPGEVGGYIETVRLVVADTIQQASNSKLITNPGAITEATRLLTLGDHFLTVKSYKDAYANFRTAYLLVSIVPGNKQP